MESGLKIIECEYNEKEKIFFIKKDNVNLFIDMGICGFNDEMEYWGMPVKCGVLNNESGFIFSKQIDSNDIKMEIERFLLHYEIGNNSTI